MAEITLSITGMFCAGCAHHVRDALQSVPGVERASVDLTAGVAQVVYDPEQADVTRMMGAVAAAGYEARPRDEHDDGDATPTLEALLEERSLEIPVLAGIAAGLVLLALYLVIISIAESPVHALEQLRQDAWFVGAIMVGFGAQAALFVHLRTNIRRASAATAAVPAGSGGVSGAAMLACCAHHLADVLPFLGLSAAAVFLEEYRGWFMGGGLVLTAFGIGFMLYTIRKVNTGSCVPANAAI